MYYGRHKKDGSYGFFTSMESCENGVFLSEDEWKELLSGQQNGQEIVPNENGHPVLRCPQDTRTYIQKRQSAYPAVAEFLDAYVKMNSGDADLSARGAEQLQRYVQDCLAVKEKYPKA